jgi:hypothetical protein
MMLRWGLGQSQFCLVLARAPRPLTRRKDYTRILDKGKRGVCQSGGYRFPLYSALSSTAVDAMTERVRLLRLAWSPPWMLYIAGRFPCSDYSRRGRKGQSFQGGIAPANNDATTQDVSICRVVRHI